MKIAENFKQAKDWPLHYLEVLDEYSSYVQRTLQFLWLLFKIGVFE